MVAFEFATVTQQDKLAVYITDCKIDAELVYPAAELFQFTQL